MRLFLEKTIPSLGVKSTMTELNVIGYRFSNDHFVFSRKVKADGVMLK